MWAYLSRPSKGPISRFRVNDPSEVPEKFRQWTKLNNCEPYDYIECQKQTWTVMEDEDGGGLVLEPGGTERPRDSRIRLYRPDDVPNSQKGAALATMSWVLLLLALVPSGWFLIEGIKNSGNAAYGYALVVFALIAVAVTGLLLLASLFCGLVATSLGEKSARVPTIVCLLIVVLYLFSRF